MTHDINDQNAKLANLLKTQKSLTEWLDDIRHSDAALIRREDNDKRERLKLLNELIGLPFDKPTQFEVADLRDDNPAFVKFLEEKGNEYCALRLMPKSQDLPKLRMRGKIIREAYEWFKEQDIKPEDYRADFVPHAPDSSWATIFIVNKHGIQGEIINGGHHQLTQGFHESVAPSVFMYDFKDWSISPKAADNNDALTYLQKLIEFIHVPDKALQKELGDKLGATFEHDYMVGYFETTDSSMGTWYIDYNQTLGNMYAEAIIAADEPEAIEDDKLTGRTGSPGKAQGSVRIILPDDLHAEFPEGSVLVCPVTTPDYVPLMQKAAAIVTDQGGILSHAAIVARELKKPCIVGTGNATSRLKDGETVVVDADTGLVTFG